MASSSAPFQTIDDDDEFDWEAAVREIDMACEATTAAVNVPLSSSSAGASTSNYAPIKQTHKKLNGAPAKQSTLDKFMGFSSKVKNAEPAPHNSNGFGDINENDFDNDKSDDNGGCVPIDIEAAKTWIYPANLPCRDYQFSITRTALFSNTLVALPTGLGKTFIAAVVMYNYFRWFPEGKIVFAAPSRPLVMQQIEACHNIVDIPQEYTIDLTGQTNPTRRASFWKEKRVFFVTPQVLEKDILSGTCMVKHLVCLVIDEAHRATGNYSYCVVVHEILWMEKFVYKGTEIIAPVPMAPPGTTGLGGFEVPSSKGVLWSDASKLNVGVLHLVPSLEVFPILANPKIYEPNTLDLSDLNELE